ncbi:MAG TPA: DUF2244 domain-containing protein [Caulobacteraceae bacterium]
MDAAPAARIHLDRLISPERSLPMTGFKVLLGVMILINLIVGTLFLAMGAWPAPIFLGLDVVGVWIAFRVSYRRAATRERVVITADQVQVLREFGGRIRTIWTSPTAFTGVSLERSERYGAQVRLSLSGKRLKIGQGLGHKAREDLAEVVEAAIRSARAERHPAP